MNDWKVLSRFDVDHLREIAMPVGGIGTGFFSLGGRGQLTEWQLMSRPHRGWRPMYCHFALWTQQQEGAKEVAKLRLLEGDLQENLSADHGAPHILAGIPRMKPAGFEASYPFGRAILQDEFTPVRVAVEAFNPLIPGDTEASSMPFGLISITLKNLTQAPINASLTLLMTNFVGADGLFFDLKDSLTEHGSAAGWKGMIFSKTRQERKAQYGTMAILTDHPDPKVARRWAFRDQPWNGEQLGIIDSLLKQGYIADDEPDQPCPPSPKDTWDSSLSTLFKLPPAGEKTVQFMIAWHFPYRNLQESGWWSGQDGDDPTEENYYAKPFKDALAVAEYSVPRLKDWRKKTVEFVNKICDHPAPHPIKEAALFNLTCLRTHTSFRLGDGTFAGFEGCSHTTGCCTGSCTHVWNYEHATISLFPDLHKSMLESHLKHGLTKEGAQRFRLSLPVKNQVWNGTATDGQMGLILRAYLQYKKEDEQTGLPWLKSIYPQLKSMMEYAWLPGGWDADQDGVMEGCQHNTYDVEFFGPNPMLTVWYLAALKAMELIAPLAGDDSFAQKCKSLRENGSQWVDQHLFNGRFYIQIEQPPSKQLAPLVALTGEASNPNPRFQVGKGCLIDQLVGQYKASRAGLGDLLDPYHIKAALKSIFKYNFRPHFRDHYNNMRTYATADESGTLLCSFPDGERPEIPFPYWGECFTGHEYMFATQLLDYGFKEEAVKVAKAVRERHNGKNRNPFNEPECGSYYARSMSSWAMLEAWERASK